MVDRENVKTSLPESALFQDLPPDTLSELESTFKSIAVPARTVVIRQGDPGDNYYIVRKGRVRIYRVDDDGNKTDIGTMGPGEGFGEVAMMTGQARLASVETLEETQLAVIPRERFDQILEDYPQVSIKIISRLSSWLMEDEAKLQQTIR
jgi:CRP-like cAMP-binding protein